MSVTLVLSRYNKNVSSLWTVCSSSLHPPLQAKQGRSSASRPNKVQKPFDKNLHKKIEPKGSKPQALGGGATPEEYRTAASEVLTFIKKKEFACLAAGKNPARWIPVELLPEAARGIIMKGKRTKEAAFKCFVRRTREQDAGGVGRCWSSVGGVGVGTDS